MALLYQPLGLLPVYKTRDHVLNLVIRMDS